MPARSEAQQQLFGAALSVKRGETPRSKVSAKVLELVDTMTEKQLEDFASTPHNKIPYKVSKKVKKESFERVIRKLIREELTRINRRFL